VKTASAIAVTVVQCENAPDNRISGIRYFWVWKVFENRKNYRFPESIFVT
jgi:hypothetical protein